MNCHLYSDVFCTAFMPKNTEIWKFSLDVPPWPYTTDDSTLFCYTLC